MLGWHRFATFEHGITLIEHADDADFNIVICVICVLLRDRPSRYSEFLKSLRNLAISLSGQSVLGARQPIKKRSTGGS